MGTKIVVLATLLALAPQQTAQQIFDELKAVILQQQQELERMLERLKLALPVDQPSTSIIAEPGQLQATIDRVPDGIATTILLRPVLYAENVVIRPGKMVKLATLDLTFPEGYRVVDADKQRMAHLNPTNNGPIVDMLPGAADVTLQGLWLGPSNSNGMILCGHSDASQTTVEQQPRRIKIVQNVIEGDDRAGAFGAKRGIELSCRDFVVDGNRIVDFRRAGQDTQAIGGWNTEGFGVIRNNELEAAGENVMLGGAAPAIIGMVPRSIIVEDNHLTKDVAWKAINATVKNHFEVKAGDEITFRRNKVDTTWAAGQAYSVVLTPQAQDAPNPNCIVANITVEDNEFTDVPGGFNIRGKQQLGTACLQGSNVIIRRNWLRINRTFNGGSGQGWAFFLNGEARDVKVRQNTVENDGNHFIYQEGLPVVGLEVTGNIFARAWAYGVAGTVNGTASHFATNMQVWAPGVVFSGNGIVGFRRPSNLPNNLHVACLQWNADGTSCLQVPSGLVVDGYGAGELAPYGRPRPQ